ncbi:hypothetical protein BGZ68_002258 [Mortierella alpina]|nr:hypothetical protein BGZ68_002258 [Mortierella alpina]
MRIQGPKKLDPASLAAPVQLTQQEPAAPWVLQGRDEEQVWTGEKEEGQAAAYYVFTRTEDGFTAIPALDWIKFTRKPKQTRIKLQEQKAKNEEIEDDDEDDDEDEDEREKEKEKAKEDENESESENDNEVEKEQEKEQEQEKVEVKAKMKKKEEEEWEEDDDKWLIKEEDVVQKLKKRPGMNTRDLIKSFAKKLKRDARNKAILIATVKKVATPRDGVLVLNKK